MAKKESTEKVYPEMAYIKAQTIMEKLHKYRAQIPQVDYMRIKTLALDGWIDAARDDLERIIWG